MLRLKGTLRVGCQNCACIEFAEFPDISEKVLQDSSWIGAVFISAKRTFNLLYPRAVEFSYHFDLPHTKTFEMMKAT